MTILLSLFSTIITGVLVFVLGQIFLKIFIDPVQELMRCLGQIRYCMVFRADIFCNPGVADTAKMDQTAEELRLNASKLLAALYLVQGFSVWRFFGFVPSKKNLETVSSELIGLSNSVHNGKCDENENRRDKILNLISLPQVSESLCIPKKKTT